MPADKTRSIPSLEKALAALELLADTRDGMTLPAIAERLGAPKSSVHCILLTLERQGYLQRIEGTRRYAISLRLVSLAGRALRGLALQDLAAPHLFWLSRATNCASHLAVLDQNEAVLIAKMEPPGVCGLATWVGRRMELHCTALGKVLLSSLGEDDLNAMFDRRRLSRHNEHTITSTKQLMDEIHAVRALGYADDNEEDEIGVRCFAVPVLNKDGNTAAAMSVSGPTARVNAESRDGLLHSLKEAAGRLSAAFRG